MINRTSLIWPLPIRFTMDEAGEESEIDPCSINYVVQATPSDSAKQIV
jgi:hypothetical protein